MIGTSPRQIPGHIIMSLANKYPCTLVSIGMLESNLNNRAFHRLTALHGGQIEILWGKSPRAHLLVGMLRFLYLTQTNRACPLLFILFLCLFLSSWPFRLCFIPSILPTILRFLTLFFRSYLCLIGPFNYIFLYESLLQPWPRSGELRTQKLKVFSGENTELKRSSFKPEVGSI